jgi:hypothetical protein
MTPSTGQIDPDPKSLTFPSREYVRVRDQNRSLKLIPQSLNDMRDQPQNPTHRRPRGAGHRDPCHRGGWALTGCVNQIGQYHCHFLSIPYRPDVDPGRVCLARTSPEISDATRQAHRARFGTGPRVNAPPVTHLPATSPAALHQLARPVASHNGQTPGLEWQQRVSPRSINQETQTFQRLMACPLVSEN